MKQLLLYVLAGCVFGCASAGTGGPGTTDQATASDATDGTDGTDGTTGLPEVACALIDNTKWKEAKDDKDPFWDNTGKTRCKFSVDANGNGTIDQKEELDLYFEDSFPVEEGTWFTITTATCNYATLVQTLMNSVPKGFDLIVRVYHTSLESPTGEFTLTVGMANPPKIVFKHTEPIKPGNGWVEKKVTVDHKFNKGQDIFFNVTNHGPNEWNIMEIKAVFNGECKEGTVATPEVEKGTIPETPKPTACGEGVAPDASCKNKCDSPQGAPSGCFCDEFCGKEESCCADFELCCGG